MRFMLLQLNLYAKAYRYSEILATIKELTGAPEHKVSLIAMTSCISMRELLNFMPQGVCCLVIPSRICYKITLSELTRLIIIAHNKD